MSKIRIIFLLAVLPIVGGCNKSERQSADDVIRLTTSIKASSGVKTLISNANVFTVGVYGWEPAENVDYLVEPNWGSTTSIPADASGSEIILNPVRNYHKANPTYIRAWSPDIVPSSGVLAIQDLDGSVDLLYTKEAVSGTRTTPVNTPLIFSHLLTQMKFEFVNGGSWDPTEKITGIILKNIALPASLNLSTGVLTSTSVSELIVQGISTEGITITSKAVLVGTPLMIMPLNAKTFKIDVQTSAKTFTDVVITTDDSAFLEGRAYTATITLTKTGVIGLTATVGQWTSGTSSGAIVD